MELNNQEQARMTAATAALYNPTPPEVVPSILLDSIFGPMGLDRGAPAFSGVDNFYVLYTLDSLDSIVAAATIQQLVWYHRREVQLRGPKSGAHLVNIVVESINNASIPRDAKNVLWLGMEPTHTVFKGDKPKMPKEVNNIKVTAAPSSFSYTGELARIFRERFDDHAEDGYPLLAYGLVIDALIQIDQATRYAEINDILLTPECVDRLCAIQARVNQFDMKHTYKSKSSRDAMRPIVSAFTLGVYSLQVLDQASGFIALDDPDRAYDRVLASVRKQLAKNGHLASSARKGSSVKAWFTHISEFYWVARRQIQHSHHYYVNVTKCRTGDLIYTNVPVIHSVKLSQEVIRSS